MLITFRPWPETVEPLRAAGLEFPVEPIDVQGDLLIRIIEAGFDIMVKAYTPHQTRRERARDGQASLQHILQISPGGRGFGQR